MITSLINGWNLIINFMINNNINIQIFGTFIWSFIVYWSVGLTYTAMDWFRGPAVIYKYKIDKSYQVNNLSIFYLRVKLYQVKC